MKTKRDISKLDQQVKVLELRIEQSEKRMETVKAKGEKKVERKLLRVKVEEETEETGAGGRQRENETGSQVARGVRGGD